MKTRNFFSKNLMMALLMGLLPLISVAQLQTQHRDTPVFDGVEATGMFTVFISQGDAFSVVVEAKEEHLDQIETSVKNGLLSIEYTGRTRDLGQLNAYVSAPEFTRLSAAGAVTLRGENPIHSPELVVRAVGASNVFLEVKTELLSTTILGASNATYNGNATHHKVNVSGASVLRAYDLETQSTEATVAGASTARVHATSHLKATASGTSTITFKETPLSQEFRASGMSSIRGANGATVRRTEDVDTVRVRVGGREIIMTDDGITTHRRTKRPFKGNWGGFELGINGYLTPDGSLTLPSDYEFMDLRYEKSIAVNFNFLQQNFSIVENRLGLVSGLGISYNNYRFSDSRMVPIRTPDGIEQLEPNPDFGYRKSKLTLMYLNVPLLMEFQVPRASHRPGFHLSGGINAGLRLRSHTKQVYSSNGRRNKDKNFDDFHLNPFRIDATARIGWGRINLFGTYSLNTLFKDDKGPELHPFSVGMRLISW
jgi:hypothetical protein